MLGANYWGKTWGTEMWLHYDGDEIRREFKQLSECGVKFLRVFPNWRDFQPVDRAYGWQGAHGEYVNSRTGETVCDDGVDLDRIEDSTLGSEIIGICSSVIHNRTADIAIQIIPSVPKHSGFGIHQ